MLSNNQGKKINNYVSCYTVFDLETTGLSAKKDQIIEISAVKVVDGEVVDEFTSLVNPCCPIPFYSSKVNGIYDDMVAEAPTIDVVLPKFIEFIGDDILVGHNIHTFDMKFICRDAHKIFGKIVGNSYVDTLTLSKACLPLLEKHNLVALATHYGFSSEGAHRALNDCHMNHKVFEALKYELDKD